jgi:hypothetical protein
MPPVPPSQVWPQPTKPYSRPPPLPKHGKKRVNKGNNEEKGLLVSAVLSNVRGGIVSGSGDVAKEDGDFSNDGMAVMMTKKERHAEKRKRKKARAKSRKAGLGSEGMSEQLHLHPSSTLTPVQMPQHPTPTLSQPVPPLFPTTPLSNERKKPRLSTRMDETIDVSSTPTSPPTIPVPSTPIPTYIPIDDLPSASPSHPAPVLSFSSSTPFYSSHHFDSSDLPSSPPITTPLPSLDGPETFDLAPSPPGLDATNPQYLQEVLALTGTKRPAEEDHELSAEGGDRGSKRKLLEEKEIEEEEEELEFPPPTLSSVVPMGLESQTSFASRKRKAAQSEEVIDEETGNKRARRLVQGEGRDGKVAKSTWKGAAKGLIGVILTTAKDKFKRLRPQDQFWEGGDARAGSSSSSSVRRSARIAARACPSTPKRVVSLTIPVSFSNHAYPPDFKSYRSFHSGTLFPSYHSAHQAWVCEVVVNRCLIP